MGVRPRLAAHDAKVPRRTARWHGGDGQVVWNVLGILVVLHDLQQLCVRHWRIQMLAEVGGLPDTQRDVPR